MTYRPGTAPRARDSLDPPTPSPTTSTHTEPHGRRRLFLRILKGLFGVLIFTGLWQAAWTADVISRDYFPSVPVLAKTVLQVTSKGDISEPVAATASVWAAGLGLAIVLGTLLGFMLGLVRPARLFTLPLIEFVRPVPSVAFIPVAIIALGIGLKTKVFVVCFASIWPIVFNVLAGVGSTDQLHIDIGRLSAMGRLRRALSVVAPNALPLTMTGVRIAASTALIVTITAEILTGGAGLGFYLEQAREGARFDNMWAGVLVTGVFGYVLNIILLAIERRAIFWSSEYRQ